MPSNSEIYRKSFGLQSTGRSVTEKALEHALDIRKFEIALYWQRASYFWALIAVTFAGYFAVLSAEKMEDRFFNAFVIASIGLIFSFAWFLVNRGSKFWQENWENHVDMLEDDIAGPLYKTILHRPPATTVLEKWIDGPMQISVSKVNQWVSLFTLLIWFVLAINVLPSFTPRANVSVRYCLVTAITLLIAILMFSTSRTNLGKHNAEMVVRKSTIIDDVE